MDSRITCFRIDETIDRWLNNVSKSMNLSKTDVIMASLQIYFTMFYLKKISKLSMIVDEETLTLQRDLIFKCNEKKIFPSFPST